VLTDFSQPKLPMDKKTSVRPAVSNESAGEPESNDASGITLLLADHERFGFAERCVCANSLIPSYSKRFMSIEIAFKNLDPTCTGDNH
jgi:hypothetical protein